MKEKIKQERRRFVYCIAVLIDKGQKGQDYAEYILNYCADRKIFPLVQIYQDQEKFFGEIQKTVPAIVLLALPGVAGLNAAEHLRSLHPKCKIIWCSDLDFSLHAFKLRVEYFLWSPWRNRSFGRGLRHVSDVAKGSRNNFRKEKHMGVHSIDAEDDQFAYRYDTQLLIERRDQDLVKIHFHTNEPWKILEYCNSIGDIFDIVVEDMIRQANGQQG